jgi:hypothetical protein
VSAWRIAVAGFGLAAVGFWARLRARDRNDEGAAK